MQPASGHRFRGVNLQRLKQSHSEEVSAWCVKVEAAGQRVQELEEELRVMRQEESKAMDWLKKTLDG